MKELDIRKLRSTELKGGARLLCRGMRDNPNNVQAFGPDPGHRERALARMFWPVLQRAHAKGYVVGAFRGGELVGLYAMTAPGHCQLKVGEKLRMVPAILLGNSLATPMRVLRLVGEWSRRDPSEPHWHFGPFAVDAHLQRQGIGSVMLNAFCARVDEQTALVYLETDKSENVRFYQKFGFTVVAEAEVMGAPNWFMSRQGRDQHAGQQLL